jgi:hypothetical protein
MQVAARSLEAQPAQLHSCTGLPWLQNSVGRQALSPRQGRHRQPTSGKGERLPAPRVPNRRARRWKTLTFSTRELPGPPLPERQRLPDNRILQPWPHGAGVAGQQPIPLAALDYIGIKCWIQW